MGQIQSSNSPEIEEENTIVDQIEGQKRGVMKRSIQYRADDDEKIINQTILEEESEANSTESQEISREGNDDIPEEQRTVEGEHPESDKKKDKIEEKKTKLTSSSFMTILNNRIGFLRHIRKILFLKYMYLRKLTTLYQVSIIIASTTITFFESLKTHTSIPDQHIQILFILLSTYIAIVTAVVKFLKVDDKKEEIYKLLQMFSIHEKSLAIRKEKLRILEAKYNDSQKGFIDISDNHHKVELEKMYRESEDDDLESNIQESMVLYNSLLSYSEKVYYKGKIVENMLMEQIHDVDYGLLVKNDTYHPMNFEEPDNIYRSYRQSHYNACLYCSYICRCCIIMRLYKYMDSLRVRHNKEEFEVKPRANRKSVKSKYSEKKNQFKDKYLRSVSNKHLEGDIENPEIIEEY